MKVTSKGNPPPLSPPEPLPPRLPQTASNAAPALEKLGGGGFPEPCLPTSHFSSHLNYHICKEKCHGRGKHKLLGPGGGKAQSPELSPPLGTWSWDGGAGGQRYVPCHYGDRARWPRGSTRAPESGLQATWPVLPPHCLRAARQYRATCSGVPPPQGVWGHWRGPSRGDACTPFPTSRGAGRIQGLRTPDRGARSQPLPSLAPSPPCQPADSRPHQ